MLNYKLAEQIRTLRLSRKMTQVELAKRLGVTKSCVSNWEHDYIQPSIEMLVRLATLFCVSTDCLLGVEEGKGILIDVTGLSADEIAHIRQLIEDLRQRSRT